jgi:hypothetical protein
LTSAASKRGQVSFPYSLTIDYIGYSGEDCPRSVIPSFAGVVPPEFSDEAKQEDDDMKGPKKSQLFTGV